MSLDMEMPRNKKALNCYIDPALIDELEAWTQSQEFPPSKTAVVEAALRAYLDAKKKRKFKG
jgi:hypothetical protein